MNLLDALSGESIEKSAGLISTAEALRAFLQNRPEVVSVKKAMRTGELTTSDLESFVRDRLRSFRPGSRFAYDIALGAIGVALERVPGAFADTYLNDLAKLRIEELPMASRVARLSLQRRRELVPGLTAKSVRVCATPVAHDIAPRLSVPVRTTSANNEATYILAAA